LRAAVMMCIGANNYDIDVLSRMQAGETATAGLNRQIRFALRSHNG
jgi:hypothetical protein